MKITKAMGRACLRELEAHAEDYMALAYHPLLPACKALDEIGYGQGTENWYEGMEWEQPATALAMCAAIAGVKP